MRLARFRLRTLLIGVGVVALLIWGGIMGTRSFSYYRLAREYSVQERAWRENANRDRGDPRSIAAKYGLQIAEYDAAMVRKWRRAMWRPWVPVDPDPPTMNWGP